jgi:pyruvate dehydrogenase E1 component
MAAQPKDIGLGSQDPDQQETREWLDALSAVIAAQGPERAHFLIEQLLEEARQHSIDLPFSANTGYVNTIEPEQEARCPGNIEIEERLRAYMRWNAMAMVVKANRHNPEDGGDLGGHIGSFASLAHLFGAGFNHFWHAEAENHGGDCIYIQGHVAPGVYARALPGRALDRRAVAELSPGGPGQGLVKLPASQADAGVLAVPHRLHGSGPA